MIDTTKDAALRLAEQVVAERDRLKAEHAEMKALLKALDTPVAEEAERRHSAMDKGNPDSVRYYNEMDELASRIDALLARVEAK